MTKLYWFAHLRETADPEVARNALIIASRAETEGWYNAGLYKIATKRGACIGVAETDYLN